MDRSHVFRAVAAQLNFCQLPTAASQVTDALCDDRIASNRQRMTYCKTVPNLFFGQQLGPGICPGSTCRSLQRFYQS
ncbi:hypothetical protein ACM7S2_17870, partial [Enterobacter hormaechei]